MLKNNNNQDSNQPNSPTDGMCTGSMLGLVFVVFIAIVLVVFLV